MVIKEEMEFLTFEEFYLKCENIKKMYEKMSRREKCIYKMYVYSNFLIRMNVKDKIWEYLNEPFGSAYYVTKEGLAIYCRGGHK